MNFLAIRVYGICLLGKWKGGFLGDLAEVFCGVWKYSTVFKGILKIGGDFLKRKPRFLDGEQRLENFRKID
jgi:hypothetical protein